jgi:putative ABC transport system ATP-binding protein
MATILEVNNLCKAFENTPILKNVSFKVEAGEFIAIMGRSGSGKSTLLYNISGMDRPTSGEVLFCGMDIAKLDDRKMSEVRLNQMGFIFQHSYLLKKLSIRDNIVLPALKAGVLTSEQIQQSVDALLVKTGIDTISSHDIRKVSGGQLQRAAICRALVNRPDILFGDEPTGALNSTSSREVMDMINQVHAEGTTVILVTHDAKVAARASRVIYLMDGNIHDELTLGAYHRNDPENANHEKTLSQWLAKQDF